LIIELPANYGEDIHPEEDRKANNPEKEKELGRERKRERERKEMRNRERKRGRNREREKGKIEQERDEKRMCQACVSDVICKYLTQHRG